MNAQIFILPPLWRVKNDSGVLCRAMGGSRTPMVIPDPPLPFSGLNDRLEFLVDMQRSSILPGSFGGG